MQSVLYLEARRQRDEATQVRSGEHIVDLQIEQRTLAQSGLEAVPQIGPAPSERITSAPRSTGTYKVFGIRPQLNLTVFDVVVGEQMGSPVNTEPCLAIDILFEAAGQGHLLPPDGSAGASIPYRPGNVYLFFTDGGATGRYEMPVGTHFSGLDIRVGIDFLERLGTLHMLESLREDHRLHIASCRGCWIGMLPTPPELAATAKTIRDSAMQHEQDLTLEARCLDLLQSAIALIRNPAPRNARDRRKIEKVRELMLADLAHGWTVSELARRVGLGEKRLKAGFREVYEKPVYSYLQQLRLAEAHGLLTCTDMSVTEVSLAVGYTSISHFARLFVREFGVLPSGLKLLETSA